ncbi:type II toxin-antitoxin system PemK/MazF family toxin [Nostoc sp. CCY 9925]|uniref:type II toxin-antitoxin system PemK/MazF family toxin n=1 Tax=Nostoc sp. CCY 9925 TaxID=3103865 RepID=UPI0039C75F60
MRLGLASPDLYPRFAAEVAGLSSPSIVLLDQIRVIDVNRIVDYRGSLTRDEYQPILIGLQRRLVLDFIFTINYFAFNYFTQHKLRKTQRKNLGETRTSYKKCTAASSRFCRVFLYSYLTFLE